MSSIIGLKNLKGAIVGAKTVNRIIIGLDEAYNHAFNITFSGPDYGAWTYISKVAYYGDKLTVSGNSVVCYVGSSSTERWTNIATKTTDTAQYSYTTPTIAESSISFLANDGSFTASNSRSTNSYTITWKYLSAYPDTWTTVDQSYNYGDTPSRSSPGNVTSGSTRYEFIKWDDLSQVVGDRTITAQYDLQYAVQFNCTRCESDKSSTWYSSSSFPFTVTYTANSNCAFDSSGTTTATATVTGVGAYDKSAGYIYVAVNSQANTSKNKSTGWNTYNDYCTYTANSGYAFDSSGTTTKTSSRFTTPGGTYSCPNSITHGYMDISTSHCIADYSSDWRELGSYTVTFTADYGYSFNGTTSGDTTIVTKSVPNTYSATASILMFPVTFRSGTGVSSLGTTTSLHASGINPSGTAYQYGTTVYLVIECSTGYKRPSDFSYDGSTGKWYKSVTVTGNYDFGTINARVAESYIYRAITLGSASGSRAIRNDVSYDDASQGQYYLSTNFDSSLRSKFKRWSVSATAGASASITSSDNTWCIVNVSFSGNWQQLQVYYYYEDYN